MLIIPILYRQKVYSVAVRLKNAYEVQEAGLFERRYESDVTVNGRSYNQSSYNVEKAPLNNVIDFIRVHSLNTNTSSFLVTSKRNGYGAMNSFRVSAPLPHITEGLDALYSSTIQSMKKTIPGHSKDRNISLRRLGVTDHITDKNLRSLQKITDSGSVPEKALNLEETQKLYQTLDFLDQFDCRIMEEATVDEKSLQALMIPFSGINTQTAEEVRKYYRMAQENAEEYTKLEYMARLLTGERLYWIKEENYIRKVKSKEG